MTEDLDEFEQFKAMAFNQNRRGSQSVPCTPQIPSRSSTTFKFSRERETSKSERRRRSTKRRHGNSHQGGGSYIGGTGSMLYECGANPISQQEMGVCYGSSSDLNERLSRLSMTEIWVRRLRMRHGSASDHEDHSPCSDVNVLDPEVYGYTEAEVPVITTVQEPAVSHHEKVGPRRSDPESRQPKPSRFVAKTDHRRSMSCRDRTRSKRHTNNNEVFELEIRPRTASVPSKAHIRRPDSLPVQQSKQDGSPKESTSEYYIVRTFSTSKKGLINRGDSFKRRKTPLGSDSLQTDSAVEATMSHGSSICSLQSSAISGEPPVLKVLMVGAQGVGKSSLLQQFTSSDYIANMRLDPVPEPGENDENGDEQKVVSVLLDNEECALTFQTATHLPSQDGVRPPDAYVIVYSVAERHTFEQAVDILADLRMCGSAAHTRREEHAAVILVANKGDIVRNRVVLEEEGKEIAVSYDCKYIEVSAVMNLRVDELLAGIVKQIRLTSVKPRRGSSRRKKHAPNGSGKTYDIAHANGCLEHAARGIMGKLFKRPSPVFRSCDNLLVA